MLQRSIGAALAWCLISTSAQGQEGPRPYAGVVAGVSTLSADGRSEITTDRAGVSLYKPENGLAFNVFAGLHIDDCVTVQGNYVWNRNDVVLTSVRSGPPSFYEQPRSSSQHAIGGDLLLYFRNRRSALRPYLSIGAGVVRLGTRPMDDAIVTNAVLPPANSHATRALLRVAVGMDIAVGHGWSARYSFSESISGNPLSAQLSPPGRRNLANFQNLFGIVRVF